MEAGPDDPLIPLNPAPKPLPNQAGTAVPRLPSQLGAFATLQEGQDEVVPDEPKETQIYATGVFENCPDGNLFEEYFVSLRKFI